MKDILYKKMYYFDNTVSPFGLAILFIRMAFVFLRGKSLIGINTHKIDNENSYRESYSVYFRNKIK